MVRILHAADFHLDSAFTGLNEQQARQRRQESRDLTRRMVEYANDHGVQLMLLAGDLFDSDSIYGQTAEKLAAALAEFRGHVVIAPGNHDCYTAASPYARTLWPDNVLIFTAPEMLSMGLSFPQYGCTVYGAAFTAPEMPESAELAGIAEQDGNVAIGILHGEAGVKDSRYRPIPLQQIAQRWAMSTPVPACSWQERPPTPTPAAPKDGASTSWETRAFWRARWTRAA